MIPADLGNQIRLVVGAVCVLGGSYLLASHLPNTVRTMNAAVRSDASFTPVYRLVRTGDTLDIPRDLQEQALELIPPGSQYALLLPPTLTEAAQKSYKIDPFAYAVVGDWLRYLLLPSRPVAGPGQARYIICFGCDTTPLDGPTTWLWRNDQGAAIGRVHS